MIAHEANAESAVGGAVGVSVFVVDPDGSATWVRLARGADSSCADALRSALGCRWFDVVRLSADRLDMWVDDEALMAGDPAINEVAGCIAGFYGFVWQPYAGRVVFASHDEDGETTSLTNAQMGWLRSMVSEWGGRVVPPGQHPMSAGRGVSA